MISQESKYATYCIYFLNLSEERTEPGGVVRKKSHTTHEEAETNESSVRRVGRTVQNPL